MAEVVIHGARGFREGEILFYVSGKRGVGGGGSRLKNRKC